jgi:hypothetical protein
VDKTQLKVANALNEIGLSMRTVFPEDIVEHYIYEDYQWVVVKDKEYVALHAIPPKNKSSSIFWEMWALNENQQVSHKVMYQNPPKVPYHDIYDLSKEKNKLFPKDVWNKSWYVIELPEMIGWGFRTMLEKI